MVRARGPVVVKYLVDFELIGVPGLARLVETCSCAVLVSEQALVSAGDGVQICGYSLLVCCRTLERNQRLGELLPSKNSFLNLQEASISCHHPTMGV